MCGDKKVFNILEILEDLKRGKKICVKEYAKRFDVSERTIQRYIKDLNCYFSKYNTKLENVERGCYVFPQISIIRDKIIDIKENEDFRKFADILALMNDKVLEFLGVEKRVVDKILKKNRDVFLLKESPIEEFLNIELYNKLERIVRYKKVIDIVYKPDEEFVYKMAKPLKIIFAEGNWYLAVLTDDEVNNGFKFLRINFIKDIKEHSKEFRVDREAIEFLNNFQSLFSRYKVEPFEVIVRVDKEVKRYFENKKFLASQKIIEKNEEFLKIKYLVTSDEEILLLVKRWFPHIKILSPKRLDDKLKDEIKKYLKD